MASERTLDQLERRIQDISLEMDLETARSAGYRIVDWLIARRKGLRESPLGRELSREETEELLREKFPEEPRSFDQVFDEYVEKVAPNAFQLDHPRFFAFIPSAPNFAGILAEALVAGTNVFAGTWLESSGPSQVELVVIDWFKEMLGLPEETGGLLVSGGSVANLTALAAARHKALSDQAQDAVVYLTDQTHASVERGLRLLGFKASQLRRIPTDAAYRMDPASLAASIQQDRKEGLRPFAVVASAGTTNTGAVDPLAEVADVAAEYSLWFHVDAAYGGFAALTQRGKKLLAGIERADSVVLDPHKWLYCPFEAGCVILRQAQTLRETFRIMPDYMRDVAREEREINFCDYGLQLTRSFRALKVWMTVKTIGARRIRAVVDQCLDLAEYAAQLFAQSPRLTVFTQPQLGVFTFQYSPEKIPASPHDAKQFLNRVNENLQARIIAGRRLMISSTQLRGRHVLRCCILNHSTCKKDVREALRLIEEYGRQAEAEVSLPGAASRPGTH
jgi:glutamate/tyrosine decarboxylase-like PLP-dependent enzyme